jgi:Family of unknown function (DUF6088)
MKLAEQIRNKILALPAESTFGYAELCIAKEDYQTVAKVLERLQKKETIKKISKGVFYKPKQTIFGEIKPDYNEQLKPFLFKNGKRVAYVTGTSLYNQLGLTTQMAFRIKIASRSSRISIDRGALKASAVKSYVEVTEDNYQLLGFLDAIKDIKSIPDAEIQTSVKILFGSIKKLNIKQIDELVKYGIMYPPRTRALLGAMLENMDSTINTKALKESLNPLTKIKIGLKETQLPTVNNWYIV